MSIQNYLNQIKSAVFGKDVRQSIHDAIKQCYDDASIDHDNANMEVKLARGSHDTLNERFTSVEENIKNNSEQLEQKANEVDLNVERKRIDNFTRLTEGSTTGDAELIDGRVGADGTSYTLIGNNIRATSKNVNSLISNVFNFKNEMIMNLLNKDNMTDGKLIDANGHEVDQTGCSFTNEYLFLKSGETITINFATYFTIAKYGTNKVFKTNIVVNNEDLPYKYTATEDCYIRFNVYTAEKDRAMVIRGDSLPSKYVGYNQYVIKALNYDKFYNVLSGNYLFVGDSICYGAGASEKGGYAKLISNLNPNMSYKNIAVSGATICRRTEDNPGTSILNKIEEEITLNNIYKHIVLEGAINDLWNQNTWTLGSYDEYDRTSSLNELTICGAFESLIRKCKSKWEDAFIYYVIPHTIDRKNTKLGFDTLINICKKYNVIVIDLRELSGQDVSIEYVKKTYTLTDGVGDGVHNNDLGYEKFYIKPIINILSNYQY